MTTGISKPIEIKNRLYKKFLKNRNERNKSFAKKDYFENLFIKYKNDIKMTWQTINRVLNQDKKQGKTS